jgi:hypothetical protein
MALHLDVEAGDTIRIGPHTTVRMERKSGQRARLRIDSSEDIAQFKAGEPVPELTRQPQPRPDTRQARQPKLVLQRP